MPERLIPVLPAVLDALTRAGVGVVVFLQRGSTFERYYVNEPVAHALGYTVEQWLAVPMFEIITPARRKTVEQLYQSILADAPLPPPVELTLIHREGHEVRMEVSISRGEIDGGHAIVLIARDLGARPQAQLSLLEADRISLVGALAAGFAHETNNPLTSVLLNLRSLRKQLLANVPEAGQPQALRCIDDITTGAERIASNVRALQTLATRSATESIDLAAVVSSALRLAAPTLQPRAHVIRQIFPVRPVAGEESRIGQAVLAMLLFSSSGFDSATASASNRIVVAVEEREQGAVVEVSDNGRDLTADEAQHAFDPFFRSSVRGSGVGVGLGIARSVVSTLGGQVVLAPRPGGGAVITMTLPLAPA